eukprot:13985484-Alexandrium_andersonii.AAC.1
MLPPASRVLQDPGRRPAAARALPAWVTPRTRTRAGARGAPTMAHNADNALPNTALRLFRELLGGIARFCAANTHMSAHLCSQLTLWSK